MKFIELYNCLCTLYPESLRCEWDNDGIMCADDLDTEVKRVLISLDVTSDTVNYAVENGFDTIISHHPLVFHSQKSINPTNYTQDKLIKLIKSGVKVMSFHTRLDASNGGVNDTLCRLLKLNDVEHDPLDPIGRIGYLGQALTLSDFALYVKQTLNSSVILASGNRTVNKVYVVGGDGKDLINNAISLGADTLLTGRASYNTSIDACDLGINIVEAGHFYTEHPVCYTLEKEIKKLMPCVHTEVYNSNKIKFF